jgi:hypothetical protein
VGGYGPGRSEASAEASAPWGPAEPPEHAPPREPPQQPAGPAISWEAPAGTGPDATPPDPGGETSLPITPPTGWRAQEPSVWDVASRQVDEDQARRGRPPDETEFTWDEDPHQQLVWGAANARAKAAGPADETVPHAEQRDDDRG